MWSEKEGDQTTILTRAKPGKERTMMYDYEIFVNGKMRCWISIGSNSHRKALAKFMREYYPDFAHTEYPVIDPGYDTSGDYIQSGWRIRYEWHKHKINVTFTRGKFAFNRKELFYYE